jgi:hypothetical protein
VPAAQSKDLVNEVRKELRSLPSYGVFDLLTFVANPDGSVVLAGYVVNSSLKTDAEKAVAGIKGVAKVDNRIEVAPNSIADDEVRRRIFRAIYRDPFLAKYGTAADEMAATRPRFSPWGNRFHDFPIFRESRWMQAPFFGEEPVGDYGIHILVKNGVVTLVGEVDSEDDKKAVVANASRVGGASKVVDALYVRPKK